MANLDWDRPIVFADGRKATLYGTLSASGSCVFADRTQEYAEHYAELYEMGVRQLVMREGEIDYRGFNEAGFEQDIHLDHLFGKPGRGKHRIVQMELDMSGMDDSALFGMF